MSASRAKIECSFSLVIETEYQMNRRVIFLYKHYLIKLTVIEICKFYFPPNDI